ncbi:hypothetical protein BG006_006618 [Podila minutissima]|uniref:Uncharacterized protein n=1 Tax=Podila minutissima TaxID=64525 RepID=A0A9P5SUL3_9FUNG|nr:hypothetical protein BG006_006618 [Podila minutissima]
MASRPNKIMAERDVMEKISALEEALLTCSPNKMRDPCYSYLGSRPREPTNSHIETLQIWITSTSYVDYYTKISLRLNGLKSLYESERLKAIREAEQLQARQTHWPFNNQCPTKGPSSSSPFGRSHLLSGRTKGSSVHDFRPHKQRPGDFSVHFTPHEPPSFRAKNNLRPWATSSGGVESQSPGESSRGNSSYDASRDASEVIREGHESSSSEGSSLHSQYEAGLNQVGQYHTGSNVSDDEYGTGMEHEIYPVTPEYQPLSMPPTPLPNLGMPTFFEPAIPVLNPNLAMTELAQNWNASRDSTSNAPFHSPMYDSLYSDAVFANSSGYYAGIELPAYVPSPNASSTATDVPSLTIGTCDSQPSPSTATDNATSAFDSDEEYDC